MPDDNEIDQYNKIVVQLRAAIVARRVTLVLIAICLFRGDFMGAVVMAIVWALLWFALPVTR